ncbi:CCA tRNA nucleotidyltransferase [Hungatella hathewayi]|uniref:CCA tRNA nucleotidyltransferase n=1 Tax=Hungatella hathewayi TaxID=154046 RepID=UPI00055729FE|nr:CCA tRNA nucleotidyltransferase [Hungatella hathewayi]MBS4986585.1 CCA tRNA nucleotidyltransferase [Hungatella hathewayi]
MEPLQIPEAAEDIIRKLNQAGFEAFVVGGCVRDTLLGRQPEDWDITTSAKPEQVKAIFGRTIDTGIQHGTVTIMRGKAGYEVTTYRIDGEYEDGRHPKSVEFTSNLIEDLKRRDFTINAMAYSHEAGLVDAFGGMEDLKQKKIRCVGSPKERFTEDALRILRAVRFSAQLGFEIEPETKKAITEIAPNLIHVSKERIQVELSKLLLSANPDYIREMYETGISPYVTPGFDLVPGESISIDSSLPADKSLRWSAFLRLTDEKSAVRILKDLKMDNDTISKTGTLVRWWNRPIPADKAEIRRIMSQMTPELYDNLILLKQSVGLEQLEEVVRLSGEIRMAGDCISLKTMAVTGRDLIEAGMKPGRELGVVLNHLFNQVLEHPEYNTKEYLLKEFVNRQ